MKTRARYIGLLVACLAVVWACKTIPINSSNVVNDAFGIVIEPTNFNGDQKTLDCILAKYDTGLYWIKTKGAKGEVRVQGTLKDEDIYTNQALKDWIEKDFNKPGFTSSALRVGRWPVHYGPFEPSTRSSPGFAATGCAANAQKRTINGPAGANPNHQTHLIKELTPLLLKYSKTPTPTPTPQP